MDDNAMVGGLWVLGIVVVAVIWALRHPQTACRSCSGSGKDFDASGQFWRACRLCAGTGRTQRWLYHLVRLLGIRPPL